jgi:hypothetical protein
LFWSFCYLVLRRVLQLVALRFRSEEFKELQIVVLRHELAVLRRQAGQPELRAADRVFLAAASRLLPQASWRSFLVTPTTLLRWHAVWWRDAGRIQVESAGRRSGTRSVTWCSAWRARIPAGATSGSLASSSAVRTFQVAS